MEGFRFGVSGPKAVLGLQTRPSCEARIGASQCSNLQNASELDSINDFATLIIGVCLYRDQKGMQLPVNKNPTYS